MAVHRKRENATQRKPKPNPKNIIGDGEDSAALIDFLLGDRARWIIAQQMSVNDGQTVIYPLPER